MQTQPLESISFSKSVLAREHPLRARLEELLAERRYEEALDHVATMRGESSGDDEVLGRCVALLEERLLKRYLRAIDPTTTARVVAPPDHPAWRHVSEADRRLLELVDGRASFEEVAGMCAAGRFVAYRTLMRMIRCGIVGAAAPRPTWSDSTALLPLALSRHMPPVTPRSRGPNAVAMLVALSAIATAVGAGILAVLPPDEPPASTVAHASPAPQPQVLAAALPLPIPVAPPVSAHQPVVDALAAAQAVIAEEPAAPPPSPPPPPVAAHPRRVASRIGVDGVSVFGMTREAVAAGVERQFGVLEGCHARVSRRPGEARAILVFDRAGRVTQAAVGRGLPPALRMCAREVLLRVRAPASDTGARADFTLRFARR